MYEPNDTRHRVVLLRPVEIKKQGKDIGSFFSSLPTAVLFTIIVLVYTLVVGVGIYVGYKRYQAGIQEPSSPIETEVAAILALLAFLLGFSFSETWNRFVRRNHHVVDHARNLRTCYLRTSLLPGIQKHETQKLFHEYIAVMLSFQTVPEKALARMDELHLLLWKQTSSLIHEDMDSEIRSLFTASVNDLISLSMERKATSLFFHIPNAIWIVLLSVSMVGLLAFGYQSGVNGSRNLFQLVLLPLAFGLVIVLIADLNAINPQGHFKVTQKPIRELLKMMEEFDAAVIA
jgi:hypothetical protein